MRFTETDVADPHLLSLRASSARDLKQGPHMHMRSLTKTDGWSGVSVGFIHDFELLINQCVTLLYIISL